MTRRALMGLCALFAMPATSHATVTLIATSEPTPGLPDFRTFTLTALSADPIRAINFAGDGNNDPGIGFGFFGPMNQVNPVGFPTIFTDNNLLIDAFGDSRQDSQFLVTSSDVLVSPGVAEEGPDILQAAWSWLTPQGTPVPLAQLVIPITTETRVFYRGLITVDRGGVPVDVPIQIGCTDVCPVFSPTADDADLGDRIRGTVIEHLFTATDDFTPASELIWSDLSASGPELNLPPTLSPDGQFSWDSRGSALGMYTFNATVTDGAGFTAVGTLTLRLVPEPVTWVLFSMGGVVALALPRNIFIRGWR